jgi:hypothetical protein
MPGSGTGADRFFRAVCSFFIVSGWKHISIRHPFVVGKMPYGSWFVITVRVLWCRMVFNSNTWHAGMVKTGPAPHEPVTNEAITV